METVGTMNPTVDRPRLSWVQASDKKISNQQDEVAEVVKDFFASVGANLASKLSPSNIDPESYLQPTKTAFSLIKGF